MIVIPFEPHHVDQMRLQDHQLRTVSYIAVQYLHFLKVAGPAGTAVVNGKIIASAGIAEAGFGIGSLWAFISEDAGPYFLRLHRAGYRLLEMAKLRRVEASTEVDFPQGCRWLELLGFKSEGPLRQYGPDGKDHIRYARVS